METDSEYSGSTICSEQLNADDDYSEYKVNKIYRRNMYVCVYVYSN